VEERRIADLSAVSLNGRGFVASAERLAPEISLLARLRLDDWRKAVTQIGFLLVLLAGIGFVVHNAAANVARLNIHIGFGFLSRIAGFDIAQTLISYPENATYLRAFVVALLNTVVLGVLSLVGGTVLGLVVALLRLARNPLLSLLALCYVEAVRNIPLLLQLFFWYFSVMGQLPLPRQSLRLFGVVFANRRGLSIPWPVAEAGLGVFVGLAGLTVVAALLSRRWGSARAAWGVTFFGLVLTLLTPLVAGAPFSWDVPELKGFNVDGGVVVIPEFVAMVIGMTIYASAFIAELIRGGITTVEKGQFEAGSALGLSRGQIYRRIVIPQVLLAILPPLTGQYINIFKNSSLAAAIGYPDLMLIFAGTTLTQTGQPLEVMGITMLSYLLINLAIAQAGNRVNRRMLAKAN
jgi:general L-amino acid transport system permease protein